MAFQPTSDPNAHNPILAAAPPSGYIADASVGHQDNMAMQGTSTGLSQSLGGLLVSPMEVSPPPRLGGRGEPDNGNGQTTTGTVRMTEPDAADEYFSQILDAMILNDKEIFEVQVAMQAQQVVVTRLREFVDWAAVKKLLEAMAYSWQGKDPWYHLGLPKNMGVPLGWTKSSAVSASRS